MADLRALLLVLAACGHADLAPLAADTYCAHHDCKAPPRFVDLQRGCFQLEDTVYQCDDAVANPPECFDVFVCGECTQHVRIAERGVISLDGCRDRAIAWSDEHRESTCQPAYVKPAGDLDGVAIELPVGKLAVPCPLVDEVERSGKDLLVYEAAVCVAAGEVTIEQRRVTTPPALASWLRHLLARQSHVRATFDAHCNNIALILSVR